MASMSDAQVDLLRRLMEADRAYWRQKMAGELVTTDDRGVEVGFINGVNPRTAQSLSDAGLCEVLDLRNGQRYAFLGSYDPLDPLEYT